MNLTKLFETQDQLDERIIEEKGLQGQDLLGKKILALQVELGELANEWEVFKFWKENPKPNRGEKIAVECDLCEGAGRNFMTGDYCPECDGSGMDGEHSETEDCLLEEYADCLSFILSIGNYLEFQNVMPHYSMIATHNIEKQFNLLFYNVSNLSQLNNWSSRADEKSIYNSIFNEFLGLGKMLGFTWEEIEQAYYKKNEINHARQENGY